MGMSRSSQTELAVLGALSTQPMTGYAVRDGIRQVLGHFWHESFGQIYPTLADLETRGLISREPGGRTGSSTFAITTPGRQRLLELLRSPIQQIPPRNGLMLRLFFGRVLGIDACRALIQQARDEALQRLREYETIRAEVESDTEHAADATYWLITVSAGEHTAHAAISWADQALAALDSRP